jgi:nucleotide-binding universal stress UspA family protein
MSNKFLVALDGSEGSKRAIKLASSLAITTKADLILTYVIDWTPYSFHTPQELEERHQRRESEIQRANDSVLQPEVRALANSGLNIETIVRHGKIAETIVAIAKENKVSQIFIGRLGESHLRTMIFGSVTAALVQTSLVPVTVVP